MINHSMRWWQIDVLRAAQEGGEGESDGEEDDEDGEDDSGAETDDEPEVGSKKRARVGK